MPETVLVTGATGFIGRRLMSALGAAGMRAVGASRANGDIAAGPLAVEAVDRVVHLAGRSFVPDSWSAPHEFYRVNVLGTISVLELCRLRGIPLTYVSSYVYGVPDALPIAEEHPRRPLNPYGHSKILAEDAVRYYQAAFGVSATIVRPFNVYGGGQDVRFLVPTLIGQAIDPAVSAIVVRDLRPRRDFLHVDDLVALLVATVSQPSSGVYNAGSGASIAIRRLVDEINGLLPEAKPVRERGEARRDEVLDVVADVSRAARTFGWTPRVSLADGIRETVAWMRAHAAPVA